MPAILSLIMPYSLFQCTYVQLALNAANAGATALENASESTLGVIADLETMIIFASAGTLENDTAGENFAGNRLSAKNLVISGIVIIVHCLEL